MRASGNRFRASAPIRHRAGVALSGCLVALLVVFTGAASAQQDPGPAKKPVSAPATVEEAAQEAASGAAPEAAPTDSEPSLPDADPGAELEAADPDSYEADNPVEEEPSLEEFLVTARKIEILVPDTTVSVIGFDPEQLRAEGIKDIRDLSNFTPSLDIKSAFAASNPTIFIRGVGLDDYNANSVGAVAIYQDGVYMMSPAGQLFQFFDSADVAVLRGPQPTLYRNASAGAIMVRSAEPTDELEGYLSTTYGNLNEIQVEGAGGGPIVPGSLSGRLSGQWGIRDGLTKNRCAESNRTTVCLPPPPGQSNRVTLIEPGIGLYTNDVDNFAARGQLLFELPVESIENRWLLNAHGGKNLGRATQYQHRGVKFKAPGPNGPNVACPGQLVPNPANDPNCLFVPNLTSPSVADRKGYVDTDDDPFAGDYDIDGAEKISLWGTNLTGTWAFGDGYELESLTAYEWHDRSTRENSDASPNLLLHINYGDTAWQVSEQLDLRGNWSESEVGDGTWVLGAFYLQEDLDVDNLSIQPSDLGTDLVQKYTQKTRNFGAYAFSEYKLSLGCELVPCDFTLTTGIRYNLEYKSFATDVCNQNSFTGLCTSTIRGEDDNFWSGPGGEVSLAWNFREDADLYLKYSHGWKGGHFNGGAVSAFDVITNVDPEVIDSYEGGLRSHWFDGRLMLNLTGFWYDYSDLQVFILEQTTAGFPITKLVNAAKTRIYGAELDLGAEPLPGLRFTYNFSWVESEYQDFVITLPFFIRSEGGGGRRQGEFSVVRFPFEYSGNPLIASPRYAMTGSVSYDIPLPWELGGFELGMLTPRFSFTWKDDLYFDAASGRGAQVKFPVGTFGQEAYWVLNASLRWRSEDGRFELLGWVRNFLDKQYRTEAFDLSREFELLEDVYADPRTYGITATIAF